MWVWMVACLYVRPKPRPLNSRERETTNKWVQFSPVTVASVYRSVWGSSGSRSAWGLEGQCEMVLRVLRSSGRAVEQNDGPGPQQGTTRPGALAWQSATHKTIRCVHAGDALGLFIYLQFGFGFFFFCAAVHPEAHPVPSQTSRQRGWCSVTKTEKPTYCSCPAK